MIYFYVFFIFVCTIYSIVGKTDSICLRREKSIFIYGLISVSLFILSFLVAINDDRADFSNYLKSFYDAPNILERGYLKYALTQHAEIGYHYFQGISKVLIHSATVYFTIFCLTGLLFRFSFIKHFVDVRDYGIIFFSFLAHEFLRKDCVQIRNGFASAIVLFSLYYLYRGKKKKFVFFVLFAACFQATALVALPLIIAKTHTTKKYNNFLKLLYFLGIILTLFFPIKKVLIICDKTGILPSAIANYLYWSEYSKPMSLYNPQIIRQIVITGWILSRRKNLFMDSKIFFLSQMYIVSTFYYLVFRDFEILAGRFGSLFYAVEAPLLVLVIENSGKNLFIKKLLLCIFYLALFLLNVYTYRSVLGWNAQFY